jgi:hypothetical protein
VANARFPNKKVAIAAILSVGLFSAVLVGSMSLASAQREGEAFYNHGEDHVPGNGEAFYNHGEDHVPGNGEAFYNHGEDHEWA